MKKEKSIQNLILIIFFVFNVYYFYRYIFKYNSEMTSPTYSDTPMGLQIAKYILAVAVIFLVFVYLYRSNVKIKIGLIEKVLAIGTIYVLIKSLQQSSFELFAKRYLFLICAYAIMFVKDTSYEKGLINVNIVLFVYHLCYSLFQISLYIFSKRLPALAYEGGLVRFGGGWDDPNAFAIYLIIPFCYILSRILQTKFNRKTLLLYLSLISCIAMEILTFSFMGYFCFLLAALFVLIRFRSNGKIWAMVIFAFLIGLIIFLLRYQAILELISSKLGSITIHLEELKLHISNDDKLVGLLFGDNKFNFSENYFNLIFMNYGLIYLVAFISTAVYFVYISYKVYALDKTNSFNFIVFVFISIFSVCQFGLPYSILFPVNYIYFSAEFWALKEYRKYYILKTNSLKSNIACNSARTNTFKVIK